MNEHKTDQAELEKIDIFRILQEYGKALSRLWWLVIVLAVACGGALGLRAWRGYTPMYASEVTFTIRMDNSSLTDIGGSTSYYDKATAEQLTKTFPYLVQSELMQTKLRQAMGVEYLNGSISAQTVENTNLFSLRVTSSNPQDAYDILMAVTEVYPQVADYVIGNTEMNLLTVPEVADAPYNAFRPLRTVCKGAVLGCVLGLGAVLLYAFTRRSIRDPEDIRRRLNLTCIATLPRVTFKRRGKAIDRRISIRNQRVSSSFQESVRSMRMKFLRQAQKQRAQVILVTSTLPGEGKTTVAVNLALSLSQSGARAILVDLDLRKPSVKKALGVETASRGVPELLSGEDKGSALEALVPLEGSTLRLLAGDRACPGRPSAADLPPAGRGAGAAAPGGGLRDIGYAAQRHPGGQRRCGPSGGRDAVCAALRRGGSVPYRGQSSISFRDRHTGHRLRAQRRADGPGRLWLRLRLWLWRLRVLWIRNIRPPQDQGGGAVTRRAARNVKGGFCRIKRRTRRGGAPQTDGRAGVPARFDRTAEPGQTGDADGHRQQHDAVFGPRPGQHLLFPVCGASAPGGHGLFPPPGRIVYHAPHLPDPAGGLLFCGRRSAGRGGSCAAGADLCRGDEGAPQGALDRPGGFLVALFCGAVAAAAAHQAPAAPWVRHIQRHMAGREARM